MLCYVMHEEKITSYYAKKWVSLGYDENKVGAFVDSITIIVIRGLSWVNFKTLSWYPKNDL